MSEIPETRDSLLVRLKDPHDRKDRPYPLSWQSGLSLIFLTGPCIARRFGTLSLSIAMHRSQSRRVPQ